MLPSIPAGVPEDTIFPEHRAGFKQVTNVKPNFRQPLRYTSEGTFYDEAANKSGLLFCFPNSAFMHKSSQTTLGLYNPPIGRCRGLPEIELFSIDQFTQYL